METLSANNMKPSRRHSIAVALRRLSLSSPASDVPGSHQDHDHDGQQIVHGPHGSGRRASIQDSLIQFSKNLKIGSKSSSHSLSELSRHLSRTTLQSILSRHFHDKKLKIAKLNVKQHPGGSPVEESELYEVEILFKTQNQRKRLDLQIRIVENQDDDEMYVYNTYISDINSYLNKKRKNYSHILTPSATN